VIGRLKEAHPERSIYNRVCEIEWNLPPGEVHCFGGIVFARIAPLRASGGFDASLVAGEEPELSQRLRKSGWRIVSVPEDMAVHDAAILRFSEWWKRTYRSGHAYAQVCAMGSGVRDRFGLRQSARVWFWVVAMPLTAACGAVVHPLVLWAVPALYLLQIVRVAVGKIRAGHGVRLAAFYGGVWLPSMFAQWLGQCRYLVGRLTRRRVGLIEYKGTRPAGSVQSGDRG
jgi:hypothetical protein